MVDELRGGARHAAAAHVPEPTPCQRLDLVVVRPVGDERDHLLDRQAGGAGRLPHRVDAVELMDRDIPPVGVTGDQAEHLRACPADDDRDLLGGGRGLARPRPA